MVEKQEINIIGVKILELEDKLMNVIEMANNYPNVPVPIFEQEMEELISKIEYLQRVNIYINNLSKSKIFTSIIYYIQYNTL